MILAILINTAVLASIHFGQPASWFDIQDWINIALTAAFTLEMFIRVVGYGWWLYLHNPWDLFDGFIVAISWIDIIISLALPNQQNNGLNILRTLRALVPPQTHDRCVANLQVAQVPARGQEDAQHFGPYLVSDYPICWLFLRVDLRVFRALRWPS
jgi:hypothetical protein